MSIAWRPSVVVAVVIRSGYVWNRNIRKYYIDNSSGFAAAAVGHYNFISTRLEEYIYIIPSVVIAVESIGIIPCSSRSCRGNLVKSSFG
ncbi:hypothetical protein D3C72_359960 [compost metagenome]